jgi:protoporphyrinogen oxidase
MEKQTYKYVILGGGVSGLSTAYELSKVHPGEILILEKDEIIGGLCKTINKNNSYYDLGSHRIHKQVPEKSLKFINEVSGNKIIKNIRGGKLRLNSSFILYPIKSFQFFISLGLIESFRCALSLLRYRLFAFFNSKKNNYSDYETYLINKAGKRAYKIFYEPYARKVWGCDPKTIATTAVKKRMSMTNPITFIKDIFNHFFNKNNSCYYYYINQGIGGFAKGIEKKLYEKNVKIVTNIQNFQLRDFDNTHQIIFSTNVNENYIITYDTLISTIPIDELVLKLNPGKKIIDIVKKVKWRGLKLVYIHLEEEPLIPGETFYFPEIKYIFGRISIPKRFSDLMQADKNYTSFVCEVPCEPDDEKWNMKPEEIYEKCHKDLMKANLIKKENGMLTEKNFIIDLTKVYPLFTIEWQKTITHLLEYLQKKYNYIYTSGKGGFFMHCNMDHSIEIGLKLAQHLIDEKEAENWYKNFYKFHSLKLRD